MTDTVKIDSGKVKMIAHRGLSGIERENTCSAFVEAGKRDYFGIETDVRKTADGKFVVIHDETTERVTLGRININVEKSKYEDIERIILPDIDGNTDRPELKIPLLADYVRICRKYGKVCVLELKNLFPREDIEKVIEEIREMEYIDNVIFISFELENCILLRELLADCEVQWLISHRVRRNTIKILKEYKLDLDIKYKKLKRRTLAKFHKAGIKVNCWTCDKKKDAEKLVDMGVDFITTNILE